MEVKAHEEIIYTLSKEVALKGYDGVALLLRLPDRYLFELNRTAHCILELTYSRHMLCDIVALQAEVIGDKPYARCNN